MSTNCSRVQRSLAWCTGKPVLPGVKRRIYYIQKSAIVRFPSLQRDANGCVQSAVLQGSFVLASDKKWKYIDILPDKSQLTSESQGEEPSITQLNKLTAVHPGVDEDATAAAAYINNSDCVFIVETMLGKYRVVGNDLWSTKAKVSQDLGQGATGTASTTIEAEASDECPAPFYTGTIETDEGDIDSSSSGNNGNSGNNTGGNNTGNNTGNNNGNNSNNQEEEPVEYTVTYHYEDNSEEDQWYVEGARIIPPTPTSGYKWPDSLPTVMPARNLDVTEVRIATQPTQYTATFTFNNNTTTTRTGVAGSALTAPANTSGYKWSPNVPSTMPSNNVTYVEVVDPAQQQSTDTTEYEMTIHLDHIIYTCRGVAGSVIDLPDLPEGFYWPSNMPTVMPAKNVIVYALEEEQDLSVTYTLTVEHQGEILRQEQLHVGDALLLGDAPEGYVWQNLPRGYAMTAKDRTVTTRLNE